MPAQLALIICITFILYLFWNDRKNNTETSYAIWIPFTWMFLAGSRYASAWLNLNTNVIMTASAYDEGSPFDAVVFALLIAAAILTLFKRKIDWGLFFSQNKCIWLYFLYCGLSIIWVDNAFLSSKRFVKEIGNVVMVLLILTEKEPYEAIGVIIKWLAFLIIPLSILFIIYYPSLGRGYDIGGNPMYTGVSTQKNTLGKGCLIIIIYYAWYYLVKQKNNIEIFTKNNCLNYVFIAMIIWVLYMAHSATSTACCVVALCLFIISRKKSINSNPDRIFVLLIAGIVIFAFLEMTFDFSNFIIKILGRDPTLTFRTVGWQTLLSMATNPIIGSGFMNFWTGERLVTIWEIIGSPVNQAHNGYVEQYLNLGFIGVAFIGLIILKGLLNVRKHLNLDYPSAMFRLCIIVIAILYNWTEASFYGINNMWIMLLFAVIEMPMRQILDSNNI